MAAFGSIEANNALHWEGSSFQLLKREIIVLSASCEDMC